MSDAAPLRVLTLNVWGLRFFSKRKAERIAAITARLEHAAAVYDVVALQELWCESSDWRELRARTRGTWRWAKFFYSGAFGSGLAILSRHPILRTRTEPYLLCGLPIHVHHGDWIVAKAAGCATIALPQGDEVDVWVTHTVAAGGEDGPESNRAHRVAQAYQLACHVRESAERGRHVICLGDLNSTPPSLALALLRDIGGLSDSFLDTHPALAPDATSLPGVANAERSIAELGVTCDSPLNTWSAGKPLDARTRAGLGKRLDYILYRAPVRQAKLQLRPRESHVSWTEVDESLGCSLSDHFGLETVFDLVPSSPHGTAAAALVAQTLTSALAALGGALLDSRRTQTTHGAGFLGALAAALFGIMLLTAGHAPALLRFLLALFVLVAAWAGTTLFYSAVIWGEWEKRALRTVLDAMALDLEQTRGRIATPRPAELASPHAAHPHTAEQPQLPEEEVHDGRLSVDDTHEQQRLI